MIYFVLDVVSAQQDGDGPLVQPPPLPTDVTSSLSVTVSPVSRPLTESRQIRSAVPAGSQLLRGCERKCPVTEAMLCGFAIDPMLQIIR